MRDFHINEHRVDDIWQDRERQQQIIQSTISTEILPISTLVSLTSSENFNQIRRKTLYPESTTLLNTEIKKRNSKSQSKSVQISDPISINNSNIVTSTLNETEKISSKDLVVLKEKEARRDEKNKAKMTHLLATGGDIFK
ncbi:2907_t:CDS:1 [Ambispora gerdemannii]|uniref:2907_t:CDS:1 n=1 Tax=Ambispora gerdemannii TaxID=144530 RepID=A0A9N9DDA7_9GLOM|nr:2907_t:CDS:1 [Ambispora gerdemannii]